MTKQYFEVESYQTLNHILYISAPACEEKKHFQQIVYSTYGRRLTRICFDCHVIETTIDMREAGEE